MSGQLHRPYDTLAEKWRDLAERRRDHIIELYESGRWRRYYSEERFVALLRDASRALEAWNGITHMLAEGRTQKAGQQ